MKTYLQRIAEVNGEINTVLEINLDAVDIAGKSVLVVGYAGE